jgi:hypothetical protein
MQNKILILLVFSIVFLTNTSFGQNLYLSRNGNVKFYSHATLEEIEASNNQLAIIFNSSNGEIVSTLLIKSFQFKNALMEEHFNENYMESDKFPKAIFKGNVTNFNLVDFNKNGVYNVIIKGELTIHGVARSIISAGTVEVKQPDLQAKSKFIINPKDYNISIPSIAKEKIASQVEVTLDILLEPKK